jgi:hypothetical protein
MNRETHTHTHTSNSGEANELATRPAALSLALGRQHHAKTHRQRKAGRAEVTDHASKLIDRVALVGFQRAVPEREERREERGRDRERQRETERDREERQREKRETEREKRDRRERERESGGLRGKRGEESGEREERAK